MLFYYCANITTLPILSLQAQIPENIPLSPILIFSSYLVKSKENLFKPVYVIVTYL